MSGFICVPPGILVILVFEFPIGTYKTIRLHQCCYGPRHVARDSQVAGERKLHRGGYHCVVKCPLGIPGAVRSPHKVHGNVAELEVPECGNRHQEVPRDHGAHSQIHENHPVRDRIVNFRTVRTTDY